MKVRFTRRYSVAQDQQSLSRLECFGPNFCWAIGSSHLLRSDNAGKTWANMHFSSPLGVGTNPHRIAFHSADEGILLAKRGPMAVIYFRTCDGGRTWTQVRQLEEGGYVWAELFALPEKQKLWSLIKQRGGKAFVETMDATSNIWNRVPVSICGEPREILFAGELTGWILERWNKDPWIEGSPRVQKTRTILHRTRDGGSTWAVISEKECSYLKLLVIDSETLFMTGEDGIFLSTDGGANWDPVLAQPRVPLLDVHFRGPIGISVGTADLIESKADTLLLISQNSGRIWSEVDTPAADAFVGVRMTTWSAGVLAASNALYTFELS